MYGGRSFAWSTSVILLAITLASCGNRASRCKNYVHDCSPINQDSLDKFPYDSAAVFRYENGQSVISLTIHETKVSIPESFKPCYPGTLIPSCECEGFCTNTKRFIGAFDQKISATDSSFSIELEERLMFGWVNTDTSRQYSVKINLGGFPAEINQSYPDSNSLILDSTINGQYYSKLVYVSRDTIGLDSGDIWSLHYSEESGIVSFQSYLIRTPYLLLQ